MRAAVFRAPGELAIEDVAEDPPGPGEIEVEVRAAVTCGTDLKSYRRGHPKLFPSLPARFGHEFAGVVRALGDGVDAFAVGDRVVAANTVPCGFCWACVKGRESLCENLEFLNGAFAERLVVPAPIVALNTHPLPAHVSFAAAAPLEPLACVVHGMAESGIELGDTVAVHGGGPIGLMFVTLARLRGARVIAIDPSPTRLRAASELGAAEVVHVGELSTTAERAAAVRAETESGRGVDVAIECAGVPAAWEQAVASVRPGGTVVFFGGPEPGTRATIDPVALHYQEYTLKGVFHHTPRHVRTALRLLSTEQLDGTTLITEERPLTRLVDSLEDMAAGRGSKYLLVP